MLRMISNLAFRLATLALIFFCAEAGAQTRLPAETQQKIDKVATDALAKTGVPSASVAVVKDGQILYLRAYGNARLDPETAAKPEMRYSIGSVSKQFLAAVLMLVQDGKLSLDDRVSRYLPNLTRAVNFWSNLIYIGDDKRRGVDRINQLPSGRQTIPWDYFPLARHPPRIVDKH
jgi:CubicO group peptidase (beta-lactamase class C family)